MKDNKNNKSDVAKLGVGASMIGLSGDRVLGKKTLYHGTKNENVGSILEEGLRAGKGGTGASEAIGNAKYIKDSSGKVHVTGIKPIADMYSKMNATDSPKMQEFAQVSKKFDTLANKYQKSGGIFFSDMSPDDVTEFKRLSGQRRELNRAMKNEAKSNFFKKSKGGKTLKIKMDYDKFKAMEIDPDQAGPIAKNKILNRLQKNIASRGSVDIRPDEIIRGKVPRTTRIEKTVKNLPKYIKNNPGRFGAGVALGVGGTILTGKAAKHLYDKNIRKTKTGKEESILENKKAKDYYINYIEKVAATHNDVWSTYKEKNNTPFKVRDAFSATTPENFRGTVKTKIRPDIVEGAGGDLGYSNGLAYNVVSKGAGRKNQILEARTTLNDVPSTIYEGEDREKYLQRMKPHIDRLIKNKKNTQKHLLTGTSVGALGGALLGKDRSTRLAGALIGGVTGLAGGVAANGMGKVNAQKAIIKNLTDDERDSLNNLKTLYGSLHAQDAISANRLIGKNYYVY